MTGGRRKSIIAMLTLIVNREEDTKRTASRSMSTGKRTSERRTTK